MGKRRKVLTKEEIKEITKYQWADINAIMNIGAIGRNNARVILNKLVNEYYQDREKIKNGLVPMQMVLDYFNVDYSNEKI